MALEREKGYYRSDSANRSFEVGYPEQSSHIYREHTTDIPANLDPYIQPLEDRNDGTYSDLLLDDQRIIRNPYAGPLNVLYVNGKVKEVVQTRNNELQPKIQMAFAPKPHKGRPLSKESQIRKLNLKWPEGQKDNANPVNNPFVPSFTMLGKSTAQFDMPFIANLPRGDKPLDSPGRKHHLVTHSEAPRSNMPTYGEEKMIDSPKFLNEQNEQASYSNANKNSETPVADLDYNKMMMSHDRINNISRTSKTNAKNSFNINQMRSTLMKRDDGFQGERKGQVTENLIGVLLVSNSRPTFSNGNHFYQKRQIIDTTAARDVRSPAPISKVIKIAK